MIKVLSIFSRFKKSFNDEKEIKDSLTYLCGKKSPMVVCINGFLTEDDKHSKTEWIDSISTIYPSNSIFHLEWESKNLKSLGKIFGHSIWKTVVFNAGKTVINITTILRVVPGIGAVFTIGDILYSFVKPWKIASENAYDTGKELGEFLSEGKGEYILVGHSLGARVIYSCLAYLKKNGKKCTIRDVHLLGGAVSNCSNKNEDISWHGLSSVVEGKIRNYYSTQDAVLKILYPMGELGKSKNNQPIGRNKIDDTFIKNIDLSLIINGHSDYHDKLSTILREQLNKEKKQKELIVLLKMIIEQKTKVEI